MSKRGTFVTIEGVDGSGKSTQSRLLAEGLTAEGHETLLTREPGGSPGAEAIRELLAAGDSFDWSRESETLLFMAARRDHLDKRILPELAKGNVVICDRYVDSTRVYQGFGNPRLRSVIDDLHNGLIGVWPDITFVLNLPLDLARVRIEERHGSDWRFESYGDQAVDLLQNFRDLAAAEPERIRMIDSSKAQHEIADEMLAQTLKKISNQR